MHEHYDPKKEKPEIDELSESMKRYWEALAKSAAETMSILEEENGMKETGSNAGMMNPYPCEPDEPERDFGWALKMLQAGHRVSRKGWNGKGQFVVYQKGYPDGIPCNKQTAEAFGYQEGEPFIVRPYLQMRCTDGTHQMWLASQSDILANDWMIV